MQLLGTVIAGWPGPRWTSKTSEMSSGAPSCPGKASPSELLLEASSPWSWKPEDLDWPAAVAGKGQAVPHRWLPTWSQQTTLSH